MQTCITNATVRCVVFVVDAVVVVVAVAVVVAVVAVVVGCSRKQAKRTREKQTQTK